MPLDQVRLGTPPLGQDGDDPRTAFTRINNNFKSLDDSGFSGPVQRTVTNLDDAIAPGWHSALIGTAANLPPGITKPLVFVATTPAGDIVQRATDVVTGKSSERVFGFAAGAWTVWRPVVSNADLGTAAYANLTTSALDFTAGRVTRVGDFGIGRSADIRGSAVTGSTPSNCYNAGLLEGFVNGGTGDATSMGIPQLSGINYGALAVHGQYQDSSGIGAISREFMAGRNGTPRKFLQSAISGSAWGSWFEYITTANAVGVVAGSQANSALIEEGSTATGRYVRFINGLQICWVWDMVAGPLSTSTTAFHQWNFPVAFADVGYSVSTSVSPTSNWDHFGVTGITAKAAASVQLGIRNGATVVQQFYIHSVAVGRWK